MTAMTAMQPRRRYGTESPPPPSPATPNFKITLHPARDRLILAHLQQVPAQHHAMALAAWLRAGWRLRRGDPDGLRLATPIARLSAVGGAIGVLTHDALPNSLAATGTQKRIRHLEQLEPALYRYLIELGRYERAAEIRLLIETALKRLPATDPGPRR